VRLAGSVRQLRCSRFVAIARYQSGGVIMLGGAISDQGSECGTTWAREMSVC
jgi:hypothetical protein